MAYQNVPGSSSQQPSNSKSPIQYAALPSHQPNSYNGFPTTQETIRLSTLDQINGDSSISSSEDGREPELSDDDILAQATAFTRRIQPPACVPSTLSKPVAIPQSVAGTGKPFARCWCPALAPYNITKADFVEFIDNLNVVSTANPPLQILGLTGDVLAMVPSHIFQLVGHGISGLAKLGTVVLSKSRTDMYMKEVNQDFFAPRHLKATITTWDAMAMALRLPDSVARLAAITDENMNWSILERRLQDMKPFMLEIRFDVPPPVEQTTVLAKMSAAQVERQTARTEKKALKQRQKQVERAGKEKDKIDREIRKEQRKYEKEVMKLNRKTRKALEKDLGQGGRVAEKSERKLTKIEEQRNKVEREFVRDTTDMTSSASKAARKDKENKQAMKALWILVENL